MKKEQKIFNKIVDLSSKTRDLTQKLLEEEKKNGHEEPDPWELLITTEELIYARKGMMRCEQNMPEVASARKDLDGVIFSLLSEIKELIK